MSACTRHTTIGAMHATATINPHCTCHLPSAPSSMPIRWASATWYTAFAAIIVSSATKTSPAFRARIADIAHTSIATGSSQAIPAGIPTSTASAYSPLAVRPTPAANAPHGAFVHAQPLNWTALWRARAPMPRLRAAALAASRSSSATSARTRHSTSTTWPAASFTAVSASIRAWVRIRCASASALPRAALACRSSSAMRLSAVLRRLSTCCCPRSRRPAAASAASSRICSASASACSTSRTACACAASRISSASARAASSRRARSSSA